MYPISEDLAELFKNQKHSAEITFYGQEDTLTLTNADIISGSLSIDRYCVSGNTIEISSAVSAELSLCLSNNDGRFNNIIFEGAELYVRVGAGDRYIPMGYFTVDNSPRRLSSISISALDRMVLFDKYVEREKLSFPCTVGTLLSNICNLCNVELSTPIQQLFNYDYIIKELYTEDSCTYRQLLQWVAEITKTCAYIDWDGMLRLEWYGQTNISITENERYSSDLLENPVTITGVKIISAEGNEYTAGEQSYAIKIEGNALICPEDIQLIADGIYSEIAGFTYTPYTAEIKPMPYMYPLDMISFSKNGIAYPSIVTNANYKLNGKMAIAGKGETATSEGYASANPLTKQESIIINTIKKITNETLNDRIQSVFGFNDLISNALGLYTTIMEQPDGSKKFYLHDNPLLVNSQTIYTMVSGGFAYTNAGWNNGNPVWEYGFSKDGNAVFKKVSAYGVEVSDPNNDYSAMMTPEAFEIWYRAIKIMSANGEKSEFTRMEIKNSLDCGKVRIAPHTVNSELIGTNIIFLDD